MAPTGKEIKSAVLASIIAGALLGVILQLGVSGELIKAEAALYITDPSTIAGWVAHILHSAVFGVIYAGVVTGYVDQYMNMVLGITQRSEAAANAFVPLINWFGMATVVTAAMGLIFGVLVWIIFAVSLVPIIVGNPSYPFPYIDGISFIAYLFYGVGLGGVYGVQITR